MNSSWGLMETETPPFPLQKKKPANGNSTIFLPFRTGFLLNLGPVGHMKFFQLLSMLDDQIRPSPWLRHGLTSHGLEWDPVAPVLPSAQPRSWLAWSTVISNQKSDHYPLVIRSMAGWKNGPSIIRSGSFPMKTPIQRRFSTAMFDYQVPEGT